jgi:hypothetical protein
VLLVLAEYVTRRIEERGQRRLRETGDALLAGRSMLVIDEAWKLVERRATGEWVNEIAFRSRHLGLFLVAISQQLSDFAGLYGKALLRNSTQQRSQMAKCCVSAQRRGAALTLSALKNSWTSPSREVDDAVVAAASRGRAG